MPRPVAGVNAAADGAVGPWLTDAGNIQARGHPATPVNAFCRPYVTVPAKPAWRFTWPLVPKLKIWSCAAGFVPATMPAWMRAES